MFSCELAGEAAAAAASLRERHIIRKQVIFWGDQQRYRGTKNKIIATLKSSDASLSLISPKAAGHTSFHRRLLRLHPCSSALQPADSSTGLRLCLCSPQHKQRHQDRGGDVTRKASWCGKQSEREKGGRWMDTVERKHTQKNKLQTGTMLTKSNVEQKQ